MEQILDNFRRVIMAKGLSSETPKFQSPAFLHIAPSLVLIC